MQNIETRAQQEQTANREGILVHRSVGSAAPGGEAVSVHGTGVILPCWQQVRGSRDSTEVSVPSADTSLLL